MSVSIESTSLFLKAAEYVITRMSLSLFRQSPIKGNLGYFQIIITMGCNERLCITYCTTSKIMS